MSTHYDKKRSAYRKKRAAHYAGLDAPKPAKKLKRHATPPLGGIPPAWLRSAYATTRDFL